MISHSISLAVAFTIAACISTVKGQKKGTITYAAAPTFPGAPTSSYTKGKKGGGSIVQPPAVTVLSQKVCINSGNSGNGGKKGGGNQGDLGSEFGVCVLGPQNEDVLPVINMAEFINSGIFSPIDINATNGGAGGDCFATTYEVGFTELILAAGVADELLQFGFDLFGSVREYVLCDQKFLVSLILPDLATLGGFDAPIIVLNPNMKVSCSSCVISSAFYPPPDFVGVPIALAFVPNPEDIDPFIPGFAPNSSGLVLDGLTFTSEPDSLGGISAIAIGDVDPFGLPIQIRNIAIIDMPNVTNYGLWILAPAFTGSPVLFEVSNFVFSGGAVTAVPFEITLFGGEVPPGEVTVCLKDVVVENVLIDSDNNAPIEFPPAAIRVDDPNINLLFTNVCTENLFSQNPFLQRIFVNGTTPVGTTPVGSIGTGKKGGERFLHLARKPQV